MISKLRILLIVISIVFFSFPVSYINAESNENFSVTQKIKQGEFNPDEFGNQMKEKGNELFGMVRSGSKFYIALALIVFFFLLLGGLIFKKLLTGAFVFLILAVVGYLILNFWPQIIDTVISIIDWFFDKGGTNVEPSPGV